MPLKSYLPTYSQIQMEAIEIIDPDKISKFTLNLRKNHVETFRSIIGTIG